MLCMREFRFGTVVRYFVRELCERAINRNIDTSLCEADEQGEHGEQYDGVS